MSWLSKIIGGGKSDEADKGDSAASLLSTVRVTIDRHEYGVVELGVRTFRLHPYQGELIERQNFTFTLTFPTDGDEFKMSGRGVVRHLTGTEGLTAQFAAPQPFLDKKLMDFIGRIKTHGGGHAAPRPPAAKHPGK